MEDAAGHQRVATPHTCKAGRGATAAICLSADSMFPPMEREDTRYYLKPMNCPFHHKIFAARPRSYRDCRCGWPNTAWSTAMSEQSGELFGLMRVRAADQNDAHIYCAEEQVERSSWRSSTSTGAISTCSASGAL